MHAKRSLIVTADDFGLSPGVNRGVCRAHEQGIVTSASLMVRGPAAADAAAYGRQCPDLSVGLHLDLCEWAYRAETWVPLYEVVPLDDAAAVVGEVSRQLAAFRELTGRDPDHIDSHQHVHRSEPVRSILVEAARRLEVPLRDCSAEIRYCGEFYGQTAEGWPFPEGITVDRLVQILAALPSGITELGCHPAEGADVDGVYRWERADELKALCDPRVRSAVVGEGIQLCSFRDLSPGCGCEALPLIIGGDGEDG